eukprot:g66866.t1
MQTGAEQGGKAKRAAAAVALQHHEQWQAEGPRSQAERPAPVERPIEHSHASKGKLFDRKLSKESQGKI